MIMPSIERRADFDAPYQVMPPLSSEEFEALKRDIADRGVQVPVEYDEIGNVLDGHHRVRACEELGLAHWPRLIRHGLSEEEKRRHARRLNLDRRHLDREQRRELIAAELRETPDASDRAIASGLGVDHKTVGSVREGLEATGEIPQLMQRQGRDNRLRKITQFVPSTPAEEKGLLLSAKELNRKRDETGRQGRRDLAIAFSDKTAELPTGRTYAAIYADPPWHRKQGVGPKSYENHYVTMTWPEILSLVEQFRGCLQPDSWFFCWIPRAHLLALVEVEKELQLAETGEIVRVKNMVPLAWAVAQAIGMDAYSTCFVWTKTSAENPDAQGTGKLAYDQDELLLLFKRGRGLAMPAGNEKFGSNHRERAGCHSEKPQFYRRMIATMVGDGVPVLEMFARFDPDKPAPPAWDLWGNQAMPGGDQDATEVGIPASDERSIATVVELCIADPVVDKSAAAPVPLEDEQWAKLSPAEQVRNANDFLAIPPFLRRVSAENKITKRNPAREARESRGKLAFESLKRAEKNRRRRLQRQLKSKIEVHQK
jgi:ParB-like chromosome segregation protein Spo0J